MKSPWAFIGAVFVIVVVNIMRIGTRPVSADAIGWVTGTSLVPILVAVIVAGIAWAVRRQSFPWGAATATAVIVFVLQLLDLIISAETTR